MVVTRSQGDAAERDRREAEQRELEELFRERRDAGPTERGLDAPERRGAVRREHGTGPTDRGSDAPERHAIERRERGAGPTERGPDATGHRGPNRREREAGPTERGPDVPEHRGSDRRERDAGLFERGPGLSERRSIDPEPMPLYSAIERERRRRISLEPPASPTTLREGPTVTAHARRVSPARSVRSTASTTTRARMAELEAAEKLAVLRRKEIEIEADLIKKRLAVDLSAIQEDQGSLPDETVTQHQKVDTWLRSSTLAPRGEGLTSRTQDSREQQLRFNLRELPAATPAKKNIEALADTLERLARPRMKCPELQTFTGTSCEWMVFKATYEDSSKIYQISPAENLQRLRSCLKGEAREMVAALLFTASDPDVIMKTLEQCFGRPEVIIDRTMDSLKKLPKPGSSAMELNNFAVKLQNIVCVFKSIGRQGYLYNPMLAREALDKLSPHMRSRWCDYASEHDGSMDPEVVLLSRFLMREADRALRYSYAPSTSATTIAPRREIKPATFSVVPKRKTSAVYNVAEDEHIERCPVCEKEHKLPECPKYKTLTVNQRWDVVKENRLCFKCINKKHRRINCKAKLCGVNRCLRPHHPTLHQEDEDKSNPQSSASTETVLTVATATNNQAVLLKMCPVTIVGPKGEVSTFALLDEGATITLIDEELARGVGAEGTPHPLRMQGVNTTHNELDSTIVKVEIKGADGVPRKLRAHTIGNMYLRQQSIPSALLEQEHLRDLNRDEVCYGSKQPGVLIGTDHWEYIVSQEMRVGKPNQPAASRTQLGWVIHGTVPRSVIRGLDSVLHIYAPERRGEGPLNGPEDRQLHELVEQHFRVEALGVTLTPRVKEDELRAMKIVEKTTKKIEKGYEVGLPWVKDDLQLPPSYEMALRRLQKIEQKMKLDPVYAGEYVKQINNLLEKGYAELCDGTEKDSPVSWYLPHFTVQNPNKPGKHRLVFDAAAMSNGVSLNDHLLEGPDLLRSLPGILYRFREQRVAVTADVKEMFLQVKIRPEDQPAQQFLWRGTEQERHPRTYKMTSMIFGAASSPFMAHFIRDHNAKKHAQTHPLAYEAITKNHYMDDFVASYGDHEEARRAVSETRTVHAAAGFVLRGWTSNDASILEDVPDDLKDMSPTQLGGDTIENKILGLYWNSERDELRFNTSKGRIPAEVRAGIRAPTKREALSAVMSIYDPLGLLSQYTVRAKIILQSLWRLKMTWDEPIPAEENELFTSWLGHLDDIANLRLGRCYAIEECQDLELHVLCDASEQAYAAVAYWRSRRPDGNFDLSLVAARAKVAPKRTLTIPRLELQAAVIGARLADAIRKEHRIEAMKTVYWTDSTTVIHWIRHNARRYTPFIAHRLGELSELTHRDEWRWLPTAENTADDATRFSNAPVTSEDRWFRGPDFLRLPEDQWLQEDTMEETEEEVILHVSEKTENHEWLPEPERFSKYETLVRATARVLMFIDKCRRRAKQMELRHIEEAERALMCRAQWDSFREEIHRLKTSRPIGRTSRLFRLDPLMGDDGVMRVRGRIEAATASAETKRPIILDGRHRITRLIVQREHCAAGHANRERVTNDLRQKFWIIHLRPTVRTVERNCALCKVWKAKPTVPPTGDLPRARLDPFHRPFTNCGQDYFGPMMVKVGRRREKRWGALYTCLTTRAVHLEIVASLSTDSAIMALRRMAARRGWPRVMYSDNATAFRGADQELKRAYEEWAPAFKEEGLLRRMEWRFIPPGAPNQGGAWERLVRSVKTALTATLHEKAPAEEVLHTLLTEAEHSINARPLTHVSVSAKDPEALTPNHFLLGSSTGLPTTGPCTEADRRTWRASQALADSFWRRWVREYLPELVPRGQPTDHGRRVEEGDVVVVVDPSLPRNVWPMGVVERTYPGPDGGVRVADVRTRTGVFRRPTRKLAVLVAEEETRAAQATPGGELWRTASE